MFKFLFNQVNVFYNVPFVEKDKAKEYRLRWKPDKKLWYSQHEIFNCDKDNVDVNGICPYFDIIDIEIKYDYGEEDKKYIISQIEESHSKLKYDLENPEETHIYLEALENIKKWNKIKKRKNKLYNDDN
jgi:hypothetical protein